MYVESVKKGKEYMHTHTRLETQLTWFIVENLSVCTRDHNLSIPATHTLPICFPKALSKFFPKLQN